MTLLPQIPETCRQDLLLAKSQHNLVWRGDQEQVPGACPNCGGAGILVFSYQTGGPYDSIITTKDGCHFDELTKKWYTTNTKTYDCPVCYDPARRQNVLWLESNTDLVERTWDLAFYDGMEGKELAVKATKQMLSLPAQGMLTLFGPYGTGKTAMLKIMVCWMVKNNVRARYVTANEILAEIRSSYGDNKVTEGELLNMYKMFSFLAIDEIDRIGASEWAMSTLFTVLDARYSRRNNMATVMATNKHPDKLGEQWGYLASRMKDGLRVPVVGKELRGNRG